MKVEWLPQDSLELLSTLPSLFRHQLSTANGFLLSEGKLGIGCRTELSVFFANG